MQGGSPQKALSMPPDTADIAVAIAKIDAMSTDMSELKSSFKELAMAVARLAIIEERQTVTNESINRAFKTLDALANRVSTLELAQPIQKQSSDFVQKAVSYIVAIVLGAIVAGLWRVPPAPPTQTPPAITAP